MKRKIWDVAPRRNGADGRYNVQERAGRTAFTIGRARRSLEPANWDTTRARAGRFE